MPYRKILGSARNGIVPRPAIERLRDKIRLNEATGCLEWTGALDRKGYARISVGGKRNRVAHRVAYEAAKGPIPDGLTLDHLCCNKRCCNPDHLEPVTSAENTRRGNALRRPADTCARGHLWAEQEPVRRPNGNRECRICRRERGRLAKRAARAGAGAASPATSDVQPSAARVA